MLQRNTAMEDSHCGDSPSFRRADLVAYFRGKSASANRGADRRHRSHMTTIRSFRGVMPIECR